MGYTARANLPQKYDAKTIAFSLYVEHGTFEFWVGHEAKGDAPEDGTQRVLFVNGPSQEQLDTAVSSFDLTSFNQAQAKEKRQKEILEELANTDSGMARTFEDFIDQYEQLGYFDREQLPQESKDRLATRAALRVELEGL